MTTNPQPRWRRWGKEALWLLLMALVISTLLDLWRSPTLPEGENVLTVALRSGNSEKLAKGMSNKGLTFPTHNDESGALAAKWQVGVTPTFLVIKDGKLVSTTTGWSSKRGLQLRLWWASL